MPINLLYHDVTQSGADDASGFAGPAAARYKLTPDDFHRHLDQIAAEVSELPQSVPALLPSSPQPWTITFDDGGVSAATIIGQELQQRGWRGWFFIATDFIGTPGFCSREQIQDLHRNGHVIGSHSCSHPERISNCSVKQLAEEWTRSCNVLAQIIGEPVTTASVPGGFYSIDVAKTAAAAGIRLLFNSEPTTTEFVVDGCRILGRFNLYRGMSPRDAASLLTNPIRRWRQAAFWSAKKAAKTVAGPLYRSVRNQLLRRAYGH